MAGNIRGMGIAVESYGKLNAGIVIFARSGGRSVELEPISRRAGGDPRRRKGAARQHELGRTV